MMSIVNPYILIQSCKAEANLLRELKTLNSNNYSRNDNPNQAKDFIYCVSNLDVDFSDGMIT